jgi:hypothetical protein
MGQTLERLAGRPYEDVSPPASSGEDRAERVPPENRQATLSFECLVCKEFKPGFVVGCANGHGACTACMPRLKATSNRCPLCRVKLIPKPISIVAPMGIANAPDSSADSLPSQEAPPYPGHKRIRADSPDRSRRARQLVRLAEELVEGPLPVQRNGTRRKR